MNTDTSSEDLVLTGSTVLDKLLNQLPAADRELVLRLMMELGLPPNDPTFPLLVAMQYYVNIFKQVPGEIESAAEDSVDRAIAHYAEIEQGLGESVTLVNSLRQQWIKDAKALLPGIKEAFNESLQQSMHSADILLKTKIDAYKKEINQSQFDSMQEWAERMENTRNLYLRDVVRQGWVWAGSAVAIALVAVGAVCWWGGSTLTRQQIYSSFGGEKIYKTMLFFNHLGDNPDRLLRCRATKNPKCTVWLVDPKTLPPEQR